MMQLSLLPEPTSIQRHKPQEPIIRDASISGGCRWWLKRACGAGPCIAWAGLNPSKADGRSDDPTMWREMEFSNRWGFGSLIKVNLIPLIASTPAAALTWAGKTKWDISSGLPPPDEYCQFEANVQACARELSHCEMRVAAWGNAAPADYLADWLEGIALNRYFNRLVAPTGADHERETIPINDWLCLGTNENGSPRHTLSRGKNRVPYDFKPFRWSP